MALAVLTGLTYKKAGAGLATDLQTIVSGVPRVFLELIEGGPHATPETRGADRTMPYRTGQLYGPRRADRLPILLRGWVTGTGATEALQRSDTAAARAEMRSLFDPTAGPGELKVTTEQGTVWTITPYPEVIVWEAELQAPTHQGLSVRLIAIDPPSWV